MAVQSSTTRSPEEIKNILDETIISTIQHIVADSNQRKKESEQKISTLAKGVFYANGYYRLLKEASKTDSSAADRLQHFVNHGTFFHGCLDEKYFNTTQDWRSVTGIMVQCFDLKKGKLPSEALKAAKEGLSFIGCGEFINITFYAALKDVWGEEKFNAIFQHPKSWFRISTTTKNPLTRVSRRIPNEEPLQKGYLVYIHGIPDYTLKHTNGEARGFNVICADTTPGEKKFVGLGLRPEGETAEEITNKLLDEYNQPSLGADMVTQQVAEKLAFELARETDFRDDTKTIEEFKSLGGGRVQKICKLDVDKITLIANQSIEEAVKTYQTF